MLHETDERSENFKEIKFSEAVSIFDLPPSGQSIEPLSLHSHLFAASRVLQALASMRILVEACKTRFGGKAVGFFHLFRDDKLHKIAQRQNYYKYIYFPKFMRVSNCFYTYLND